MSVKHVKEYYDSVVQDFLMMRQSLKELESIQEVDENNPLNKNIETIKHNVSVIKENYMRVSYILYLLNMPNKKDKKKRYIKQNEKLLNSIPNKSTLQGILEEDDEALQEINQFLKH